MSEPSIKGTVFQACIDDLQRLVDTGRIGLDELATRLSAADVSLLDEKIHASQWYPIAAYSRIIEALKRIEAPGDPDYFRRRGARSAKRLVEAGLYQQLSMVSEASERDEPPTAEEAAALRGALGMRLKLAITLASAIYDVGRWTMPGAGGSGAPITIEIAEASAYTQPMREAIEGFFNGCVEIALGTTGRSWRIGTNESDRFVLELVVPIY